MNGGLVGPGSARRPRLSPQTGRESGSLPPSGGICTWPSSPGAWGSHCRPWSDLWAGAKQKRARRAGSPSKDDTPDTSPSRRPGPPRLPTRALRWPGALRPGAGLGRGDREQAWPAPQAPGTIHGTYAVGFRDTGAVVYVTHRASDRGHQLLLPGPTGEEQDSLPTRPWLPKGGELTRMARNTPAPRAVPATRVQRAVALNFWEGTGSGSGHAQRRSSGRHHQEQSEELNILSV